MKGRLLFVFLILAILSVTHCCDSSVSTLSCQFYVQSTTQDCTAFNLDFCQWTVCDYYVTDSNNNTYCGQYSTLTSSSWGKCLSTCCHDNGAPQTYEALTQCYEDNKKIAIIIGSVVGGVVGLVIIICLVYKFRDGAKDCLQSICRSIGNCCAGIGECFQSCFRRLRNLFPSQKSELEVHMTKGSTQPQLQLETVKDYWMDCQLFNSGDENCPICLDNVACVRLECKHAYHKHCILDWIARRAVCRLCNNYITKITLFCKKCMKRKREMSLQIARNNLNIYGQCCDSCG